MGRFHLPGFVLLLVLSSGNIPVGFSEAPDNGGIFLPEGFRAIVVVDSLPEKARHIAVRQNGDIYVKLRFPDHAGGNMALRDTNQDVRADQLIKFGDYQNRGSYGTAMRIYRDYLAGRDSLLNIGPLLILLVLIHNLSGYFLGYWFARMFHMNERDARTVAIEVGMQNGGLASGIAKEMGKIATVGLAAAVFGPLMNITGSILASYWHKKNPH